MSPFLLLDYAGPASFTPTTDQRGVGEHPHRGFETVTIVYRGEPDADYRMASSEARRHRVVKGCRRDLLCRADQPASSRRFRHRTMPGLSRFCERSAEYVSSKCQFQPPLPRLAARRCNKQHRQASPHYFLKGLDANRRARA